MTFWLAEIVSPSWTNTLSTSPDSTFSPRSGSLNSMAIRTSLPVWSARICAILERCLLCIDARPRRAAGDLRGPGVDLFGIDLELANALRDERLFNFTLLRELVERRGRHQLRV